MKKAERIALLKELIETSEIHRQEDLVLLFRAHGARVTQATISRDVRELGLVKKITDDGFYRYSFADGKRVSLQTLLEDSVNRAALQGNLVVLEATPGTPKAIKTALKSRYPEYIFAIMTDDDSVVVIAKSGEKARNLLMLLQNLPGFVANNTAKG